MGNFFIVFLLLMVGMFMIFRYRGEGGRTGSTGGYDGGFSAWDTTNPSDFQGHQSSTDNSFDHSSHDCSSHDSGGSFDSGSSGCDSGGSSSSSD
ncbi:MAG TPA: hypothetical protein VGH19_21585 [Verrucomicrobiae bacterium]